MHEQVTEKDRRLLLDLFPILKSEAIQPSPLLAAHFDNASTSQKPQCVIDTLTNFYVFENANVHRGLYSLSAQATEKFEQARETLADWLKVESQHLVFTSGTTAGLNLLARSLSHEISQGDVILSSVLEHHSNLLPWIQLAEERQARVEFIPVNAFGELDLTFARRTLEGGRVKLVSLTGVSHVLGNSTPHFELFKIAKSRDAICILDGAQMGTMLQGVMQSPDIDAIAISGHKLHAPFGIGALALSSTLAQKLKPVFTGGGMVSLVPQSSGPQAIAFKEIIWNQMPHLLEAGTPPVAEAIAFAEAIRFIQSDLYRDANAIPLIDNIARELFKNPRVELYGWARSPSQTQPAHGSVLSFNIHGQHPHDVAQELADRGIHVRAGYHCAQPLMNHLKLDHSQSTNSGTVRISLAPTSSAKEANHFLMAIREMTGFTS